MVSPKSFGGRYFEDFSVGLELEHSGHLTIGEADATLYRTLTGLRFPLQRSRPLALAIGLRDRPVDDILVFKIAFGHSVPDVSMRAVATLGYGDCRFGEPVYPGDTLSSRTSIIGLEPGPSKDTGIVYVRTRCINQNGAAVVSFIRWVSVRRRAATSGETGKTERPDIPATLPAEQIYLSPSLNLTTFDTKVTGSSFLWEDYSPGEQIDHVDGCTIEESESMMVARLYQNTAPPHYNAHAMAATPFQRRIVFVGHIVGLARSLTYNGLANVFKVAAINRARHLQATFADATIYAWTQVIERTEIPGRRDVGALRLRTIAVRDEPCSAYPLPPNTGGPGNVLLDLDYVGLIPRRTS